MRSPLTSLHSASERGAELRGLVLVKQVETVELPKELKKAGLTILYSGNFHELDEVEKFVNKTFADCRSYPTHAHVRTKICR